MDARRATAKADAWRVESARRNWPVRVARPHPVLRPLLARPYVGVTATSAPHRLLMPATASVPLVLKICDSRHRPPAFLHGVHDRYALMEGDCARSYLEVWMAPLGAYRLLGRPIGALGNEVVDLGEVFGPQTRRLLDAVRAASTWGRRFELLDGFLVRAADRGPRPSPEVSRAWGLLLATGGTLRIGQIADQVGWSHKHLITRFTQQVGLPPKTSARLVRFESVVRRVLDRVDAGLPTRWDLAAADGGYADQAHLIRDFRAFAGVTPTDFLHRAGRARRWEPPVPARR